MDTGKGKHKPLRMPPLRWQLRVLLYIFSVTFIVITLSQLRINMADTVVINILYGLTAISMVISIAYLIKDISYISKVHLKPTVKRHPFTKQLTTDYQYRTVLFTYLSLLVNLMFAVINGVYGYRDRSWWFFSFAIYYILLSLMRFHAIRMERRNKGLAEIDKIKENERKTCKNCGFIFILLTICFIGTVILIVTNHEGKSYPGLLIFAVATYTFYKITIAVINLFRARKMKNPIISIIRYIGYADALVSLVLLQTAMYASFGQSKSVQQELMNGITGGAASIMMLAIGVSLFYKAKRKK